MSGIAGILNWEGTDTIPAESLITAMLAAIRHRGPDESSIFLNQYAGLGNVQLATRKSTPGISLSETGKRYRIVYDGVVFNYPEIREDLKKLGAVFSTDAETEVVGKAWEYWGPECLNRFNGQFAIAVWDNQRNELTLVRDRLGTTPLFYTQANNNFVFCSEMKGIFQVPGVRKSLNHKGLAQTFSFWTTVSPETPFEEIFELSPGHYMTINKEGGTLTSYWRLSFPERTNYGRLSLNEASEELYRLLKDAVKIRLRADVEVGAYLSGGIDSSATTALIKEVNPGPLSTFSIGFSDKAFDESSYQQEAAAFFNTRHTAFSCTSEEIGQHFFDTVRHAEYPILRTAPTPMFLLSKKVSAAGFKAVLTGEGSDEILGGYNIFKEAKIRRFWAKNPQSEFRPMLLKRLYPYLPMMKDAKTAVLKMFFGFKLSETDNPFYSHLLRWHNTSRINNYLSDELISGLGNYNPQDELIGMLPENFDRWGDLQKSQYLEIMIFMSGYLLSSQGDRMIMANSVESRFPFLDHRVIEFASTLPENYKLNGLNEKFILKKAMQGKIPESIQKRNKQAYRAPVSTSLSGADAPEYIRELLSEAKLKDFGIFDPGRSAKLIEKVNNAGAQATEVEGMALAGILSTQLLHHFYISDGFRVSQHEKPANLIVIRD